jgi:hypothetical protein
MMSATPLVASTLQGVPATAVTVGNQVVRKPMHPAAVLVPPGMPSKARSLTWQQYNEVMLPAKQRVS